MSDRRKTTPGPKKTSKKPKLTQPAADRVLYLYAIAQVPKRPLPSIAAEGIDGSATVEAVLCEGHVCWISRVARDQFADHLAERMQDLEWLASAGLRHQRVGGRDCRQADVLCRRDLARFFSTKIRWRST